MRHRIFALLLLSAAGLAPAAAQDASLLPFSVELVETAFPGAPGLHSGSFARAGGRWLFVGGRTNGLHGFRENAFPPISANGDVWVLDPATREAWSASLDALPDTLADPLRATNPQFYQDGDRLYVVGGFGDDSATRLQQTFATLTALDVPGLIAAVVEGGPLAPHVRQITDERLRVTGGILEKLGDRFYLVFGHHFDGYYSRDTTTFFQRYTEEIRSFRIEDDGASLRLADYAATADPAQFHRRDLNAAPVVLPGEREGLAAYGGVFRPGTELPWLHPVYFDADGYAVDTTFEQRMSQYTCPVLPLYDHHAGAMHTVFFGGISLYAVDEATGVPVRDDLVPFVADVTALTRRADGTSYETILPVRLPALLGSNAYFIPEDGVPRYDNGVVRLADLAGRTRVGYLFGGIEADRPNQGRSRASNRLFEVYVTPQTATSVEDAPEPAFRLEGPVPNPTAGTTRFALALPRPEAVRLEVFNVAGQRVGERRYAPAAPGEALVLTFDAGDLPPGLHFYRISGPTFSTSGTLVVVGD